MMLPNGDNFMNMAKKTEIISNANSRGLILDYYGTGSNFNRKADFNLRTALKVIKNDPVVKGAIISIVDKVMETPYQVVGRDKRSKKKKAEQFLYDLRFSKILRQAMFNLILYGNAFIEIVKKKSQVTDLNVLETIHMDIKAADNGDIKSYEQIISGKNNPIIWNPEQIIHIKLSEITTNVWGEVDIESIYDTVLLKDYMREWLKWFFKTNQAKGFYNIKSANSQKVKDFLANIKANETNPGKPVIAQGEITYQVLRNFSEEGKDMKDLMLWCDTQILALLQVPPIVMGFPDQSGRSNSVEQFKALNTRVVNIHRILEDYISHELLPKSGFDKVTFEFGAIDDQQMKSRIEIIKMMKDTGFTNDAIEEYMRENNLFFETKNIFNEPKDLMQPVKDSAPLDENSHKKSKGEGEPNKQKDNISTREDQLVKNSLDVIEPTDQWKEYLK